jgi:DNA polymerase-3 subunit alpha
MLLSQKLAGFTKGEADTLRKAMGKKKLDLLEKLKPKFLNQGNEKGHSTDKLEKIWSDWEDFASYAFNKSHSTCYAWIAYQTAYLKANYPAEYMASVLSNNMNDIKQVSFFMEECKRMGVPVLGPDVNESNFKFTVNKEGAIRFGLGAIKGVGLYDVGAGLSELSDIGVHWRDHQMHVEGLVRPGLDRLQDRRADGEVRHEMPVHHVDMNPVGTRRVDGFDFVSQPGEISRQDRRRNDR